MYPHMKKTFGTFAIAIAATLLLGAGCVATPAMPTPTPTPMPTTTPIPPVTTTRTITYVISKADPTKYCNGVDMDTAGYRKTITTQVTTTTPSGDGSDIELVKTTIGLATTGMCHAALTQLDVTVDNGTVTIPPIDGWSGVSISMCSCKPEVEVNLLRLPRINKVIWK
jgi:hypothetical protein